VVPDEEPPLETLGLRIVQSIDDRGHIVAGVASSLDQQDAMAGEGEVAGDNAAAGATADDNVVVGVIGAAVAIGRDKTENGRKGEGQDGQKGVTAVRGRHVVGSTPPNERGVQITEGEGWRDRELAEATREPSWPFVPVRPNPCVLVLRSWAKLISLEEPHDTTNAYCRMGSGYTAHVLWNTEPGEKPIA
jgi:hypothetical protein